MTSLLQRFFNVRREEVAPLTAAAAFFFCVLTALMMLRPVRDALGMQRGIEAIRWLFIGTALITLAVNPVFGWLVSRFRRMTFITITYVFFATSLVAFWALIVFTPDAVGETSGQVFYVWFSVFNLFSTMVFWALMADRFTLEQSKRIFGVIAVGGTLGAIAGPWLAGVLVEPLGTPALLLVAAVFLLLAIVAAWLVSHLQPRPVTDTAGAATAAAGAPADAPPSAAAAPAAGSHNQSVIGGSAWEGLSAVVRSPYLLGISSYVLIMTITATFIYMTRLAMVDALGDTMDEQTQLFAWIDLMTQVTTLVLQAVVTGHIMKRFGVAVALALLPVVVSLGFIGLAMAGSFAVLVVFEATFRAVQRAVTRPARETLFTVVSREDKYKSKAVTDTFVYRGGDVLGAWTEGGVRAMGFALAGLATLTIPLAVIWLVLGVWLGRQQEAKASSAS